MGLDKIEGLWTEEDAEENSEWWFREVECVADEEGKKGVEDKKEGKDDVGQVRWGGFELGPHLVKVDRWFGG